MNEALYTALCADLSTHIDTSLPGWSCDSASREVACYALRDSLLKKYNEEDVPSSSACAAALEKFKAVNERMRDYVVQLNTSQDEMLYGELKLALHAFWHGPPDSHPVVPSWNAVFYRGRTGPGSSIASGGTDFYTKMFSGVRSGTERAMEIWQLVIPKDGLWAEAEMLRSEWFPDDYHTESNNTICVKKTTTIARTIAVEPLINMWLQLGVGSLLNDRSQLIFGYDPRVQPARNAALAYEGSRTGRYATIDLSSASDSFSYSLMKELLPRQFFSVLDALRVTETVLPDGSRLRLNMLSTMGNGYTFAFMTAFFHAVVQSVYKYLGIPFIRSTEKGLGTYGVFGDDIIVDVRACRLVLRLLHLLGFEPNPDKTFVEGPFRESCGADYHLGANVRGVYIKSLVTLQEHFVAFNGLLRWSAKTSVALPRTFEFLCDSMRRITKRHSLERYAVPLDENDDAGLKLPLRYVCDSLRIHKGGAFGYWAYQAREWLMVVGEPYVWTFKRQKRRRFNPPGLEIAAIQGGLRGYAISLRQEQVEYSRRRKVTPRWDYLLPETSEEALGADSVPRYVEAADRCLVNSGLGVWAS